MSFYSVLVVLFLSSLTLGLLSKRSRKVVRIIAGKDDNESYRD